MITGLLIEPRKMPQVITIDNTLEELQKHVGGYIEFVYLPGWPNVCLVVNEEGRLIGLPPNRYVNGELLVGNILVLGLKNADTTSLDEKSINEFKKYFGIKSMI